MGLCAAAVVTTFDCRRQSILQVVATFDCRRQSILLMQKSALERDRAVSVALLCAFPVALCRDATRAVIERVRGSSVGHSLVGSRVRVEHTRYPIQGKETHKKHLPKKILNFVRV